MENAEDLEDFYDSDDEGMFDLDYHYMAKSYLSSSRRKREVSSVDIQSYDESQLIQPIDNDNWSQVVIVLVTFISVFLILPLWFTIDEIIQAFKKRDSRVAPEEEDEMEMEENDEKEENLEKRLEKIGEEGVKLDTSIPDENDVGKPATQNSEETHPKEWIKELGAMPEGNQEGNNNILVDAAMETDSMVEIPKMRGIVPLNEIISVKPEECKTELVDSVLQTDSVITIIPMKAQNYYYNGQFWTLPEESEMELVDNELQTDSVITVLTSKSKVDISVETDSVPDNPAELRKAKSLKSVGTLESMAMTSDESTTTTNDASTTTGLGMTNDGSTTTTTTTNDTTNDETTTTTSGENDTGESESKLMNTSTQTLESAILASKSQNVSAGENDADIPHAQEGEAELINSLKQTYLDPAVAAAVALTALLTSTFQSQEVSGEKNETVIPHEGEAKLTKSSKRTSLDSVTALLTSKSKKVSVEENGTDIPHEGETKRTKSSKRTSLDSAIALLTSKSKKLSAGKTETDIPHEGEAKPTKSSKQTYLDPEVALTALLTSRSQAEVSGEENETDIPHEGEAKPTKSSKQTYLDPEVALTALLTSRSQAEEVSGEENETDIPHEGEAKAKPTKSSKQAYLDPEVALTALLTSRSQAEVSGEESETDIPHEGETKLTKSSKRTSLDSAIELLISKSKNVSSTGENGTDIPQEGEAKHTNSSKRTFLEPAIIPSKSQEALAGENVTDIKIPRGDRAKLIDRSMQTSLECGIAILAPKLQNLPTNDFAVTPEEFVPEIVDLLLQRAVPTQSELLLSNENQDNSFGNALESKKPLQSLAILKAPLPVIATDTGNAKGKKRVLMKHKLTETDPDEEFMKDDFDIHTISQAHFTDLTNIPREKVPLEEEQGALEIGKAGNKNGYVYAKKLKRSKSPKTYLELSKSPKKETGAERANSLPFPSANRNSQLIRQENMQVLQAGLKSSTPEVKVDNQYLNRKCLPIAPIDMLSNKPYGVLSILNFAQAEGAYHTRPSDSDLNKSPGRVGKGEQATEKKGQCDSKDKHMHS